MFEFEDYALLGPNAQSEGAAEDPPAEPSLPPGFTEERMESLEEANEAMLDWFDDTYGENPETFPSNEQIDRDLREDLRNGDDDAWNAMWQLAEFAYGLEDIQNDPFWSEVVVDDVAESIYGTSEGLIWDAEQGKIVFDPNYVLPPPVNPTAGDGNNGDDAEDEEEDEDKARDDDEDEFEFYDDDEEEDDEDDRGGTVTVLLSGDDEDGA